MAVPQRRPQYQVPVEQQERGRLGEKSVPRGESQQAWRGRARRGLTIVLLAVVPMLLMLGSVYMHTVAAGLKGETARLQEEKARAEGEGERLDVQITELSEPGRIRALARKYLEMQDPNGKELETYRREGEDIVNGGEKKEETGG